MIIFLISWVCCSVVFCLAVSAVAARQLPHLEEQIAHGSEPALDPELAVALGEAKTARPLPWPAHYSPAARAKRTASTISLAPSCVDHYPAAREVAVLDAV